MFQIVLLSMTRTSWLDPPPFLLYFLDTLLHSIQLQKFLIIRNKFYLFIIENFIYLIEFPCKEFNDIPYNYYISFYQHALYELYELFSLLYELIYISLYIIYGFSFCLLIVLLYLM